MSTTPVSGLILRALTGVVLIAVALAAVWAGGQAFSALTAVGGLLMFAEWSTMHRLPRLALRGGLGVLAGAVLLAAVGRATEAVLLLGFGGLVLGTFVLTFYAVPPSETEPRGRLNVASSRFATMGLLYCGLPVVALIWLRGLPNGAQAVLWTMATVWATDIAAYFTGRALGGAKLAASISPNKTWSGAIGGIVAAALTGGALTVAYLARTDSPANFTWFGKFALLAAGFAVLAILGDLFESGLKRRAGVKDSGHILPGHGGVLDRLDGLVPVACASALLFAATGWAG